MHPPILQFSLTALVALLVVVDPFGLVPIFTALTTGMGTAERRRVLARAVAIALGVSLFFLLAGRVALVYLGVSVYAFAISGGILLFATALPMLFGQRAGLQSAEQGEQGTDIAVFPLAIPLLSGPGTLTTILLLSSQAQGELSRIGALALAILLVFLAAWLTLRLGGVLMARVGEGGVHVATRVLGIVLAALAVQFVLNGFTGYYHSLVAR